MERKEQEFLAYLKEISSIEQAVALLAWDARTLMPEGSSDFRSESIGYLSGLQFEMKQSGKMKQFIQAFEGKENTLGEVARCSLAEVKKNYELNSKLPKEELEAYIKASNTSENLWGTVRANDDFATFEPHLDTLIQFNKKFIDYWRKDEKTPYDVLLNQYEPGMTVEILDDVFSKLRAGIIALMDKIKTQGTPPRTDFIEQYMSKEDQRAFSEAVIKKMGYRFEEGRLDDTIHPFMQSVNRADARITTRWNENFFKMAIFGIIHEAGHGIYEQNVSPKWDYTPVSGGVSMGIHESQSLFHEIVIGSNRSFWQSNYDLLKKHAHGNLDEIDFDTFYRGLNETKASLIRVESDTLTYPLHIIIRYEIEKMIFNGEVATKDLPQIWNDKYEEYLGIRPANNREGILQDIHWAGGSFGYFPSYALGFMYAAQLKASMEKEMDISAILATDDYHQIREWLTDKIHQYGKSKTPSELMMAATGEVLNPQHLLDLQAKIYGDVYQF
ncbi:carboxypeptidase M32 [Isobaculum melis]|uniref:Metal-dependent carboxypeptidase n=1 Tax=Isobaculum melis TaxID=142588 RepID=A0A1H9RWQ6_9LACT|nr:carboxypeptidase M32 [Isobaculum melis]SER77064.1 carboxypeptidase Taq [Isobaculum melis]